MRSKLLVGQLFLAVVAGFLLVTNPIVAEAAIRRCEVTAKQPRQVTPTEASAAIEGHLACDQSILPERFTNTVCLQAKKAIDLSTSNAAESLTPGSAIRPG